MKMCSVFCFCLSLDEAGRPALVWLLVSSFLIFVFVPAYSRFVLAQNGLSSFSVS